MSGTPPKLETTEAGPSRVQKRSIDFDYWASKRPSLGPTSKGCRTEKSDPRRTVEIAELTKGNYFNSTVNCRVTLKKVFEAIKQDEVQRTLNIHIMDGSGEIAAVAFASFSQKFIDGIMMNECYSISNFVVIQEDVRYPSYTKHGFKIKLTEYSTVAQLSGLESIPPIGFNFVSIETLETANPKKRHDILAICVKNWGLDNNPPNTTRHLTLFDKSLKSIRLTLWNSSAEEFGEDKNVLVAVRKAVVSEFDRIKFLDSRGYSLVWKKPQLDDGGLMKWFNRLKFAS